MLLQHLVISSAPSVLILKNFLLTNAAFEPFDDARAPFDVRYYLVAILFIIFDLETAFLVPWAVVFRRIRLVWHDCHGYFSWLANRWFYL